MSASKHIDRICAAVTALCVVLCLLFMNGEALGVQPASRAMGYEARLFDPSRVHTIDIVMDDWDSFIETCESEEYAACTVVIDGEAYKNTGIRAKGNTSLSTVSQMGSDRYSFKVEFDHYNKGKSYYGLDKLCLNNLIQDNTYMKDYLTYRMMAQFGAAAPLCSYVYITVNGEDWGLYLAVEGVEESFLQRNYGSDYGELYKPDSMSFGGGRGNGRGFDMDDFMDRNNARQEDGQSGGTQLPAGQGDGQSGSTQLPAGQEDGQSGSAQPPAGQEDGQSGGAQLPAGQEGGQSGGAQLPAGQGGGQSGSTQPPVGQGGGQSGSTQPPAGQENGQSGGAQPPAGFDPSGLGGTPPAGFDPSQLFGSGGEGGFAFGGRGGGFGMGSDEVKLKYTGDDPDSYADIFDSAKTDVSAGDKVRLIQSLKVLSEGGDVSSAVDVDGVLRYFAVHNFVVNADSYTGTMVHNYYLYEEDGLLSMLPWDYNLAFGTFQAGDASGAVNDPIDSPLSVSGSGDRPMADWLFSSEENTRLYHQYLQEFLDTVDPAALIEEAAALIEPYVERDPSKFCTAEEFRAGVAALNTFCALRRQSVEGQLAGDIPSTLAGQQADSSALVDTAGLDLTDMGSMGAGRGAGPGGGFPQQGGAPAQKAGDAGAVQQTSRSEQDSGSSLPQAGFPVGNFFGPPGQAGGTDSVQSPAQQPEGIGPSGSGQAGGEIRQSPGGRDFPGGSAAQQDGQAQPLEQAVLLAVSLLVLAAGLVIAFKAKRR